jgi:DNA-binding transcriptional MocR family regulator
MNATPALTRGADVTLTDQLAARFSERIAQRLLPAGARLPSVRECARRHAVSASTVVAAYDRLLAQGLIVARRQRGFFVRDALRATGTATAAAPAPARGVAPLSATTLMRGMFQPPGAQPMPGLGTLPLDWLDAGLLAAALRRVSGPAALAASALQYGEPAGDARLRRALALRLADLGVKADASQIVTTIGATQALDVVTRALVRGGDAVLVDEPGWPVEYARLEALGLTVLPVPRGEDGPDLAVMEQLLRTHRPRLYVTVSVLHNPTGYSLTLASAHRLLGLGQRYDLTIVEDDSYAHFAPAHQPRLAALDSLQRTIYVSGFSKILAPGWRVGFIAAPPSLVDRFVDARLLASLTTPALAEQAVAHCLETGALRRHAERIAARLDAARTRTVRLAEAAGCRFAAPPRGLFGWVDTGADTERLARRLLDEGGWLIAPGALFQAVRRPSTLMRINFATAQEQRFWRAFERARGEG